MKVLLAWHAAVESSYRKLFYHLVRLGVDLTIIVPNKWTEGSRLQPFKKILEDTLYKIDTYTVIFRDRIRWFFYPNIFKLSSTIIKLKPDIFHIFEEPFSLISFEFLLLKRLLAQRSKLIFQSCENMFLPQRFPFSFLERAAMNSTNLIIAVPEEGKKIWRWKGYRGNIINIPLGVDEGTFFKQDIRQVFNRFPFLDTKKFKIVYVGRLLREKGIETLLEAARMLLDQGIELKIYLVGSGPWKEALIEKIKQMHLGDHIDFIGPLTNEDLAYFLSGVNVLVLPSIRANRWKEQFGRVLVEAMLCELPVVGSSSGEIPNVIKNAGLIFPEKDAKALAEILKRLFLEKDLRLEFAKRGRERALANFTWEAIAKRLFEVYKSTLEKE